MRCVADCYAGVVLPQVLDGDEHIVLCVFTACYSMIQAADVGIGIEGMEGKQVWKRK